MLSSFLVSSFFREAARQVKAVVTMMPPRKSDNGSNVDSSMMPVPDAASPSDATPIPVEVQMNCDSISIVLIIRTFYFVEATDSHCAVSPVRFSHLLIITSQ